MTPSASPWCGSIAGQTAFAAPDAAATPWYGTAATTRSRTGNATGLRCAGRFDDLTGTVLAGHHQPLRVWVLCLYFMGLNLSNRQIALELGPSVRIE